jgi:hypothetical protein
MQISATTHGTVDQGGSICGPEKNWKELQIQTPQAQSFRPSVSDGAGLCCLGGTAGAGEYLE